MKSLACPDRGYKNNPCDWFSLFTAHFARSSYVPVSADMASL